MNKKNTKRAKTQALKMEARGFVSVKSRSPKLKAKIAKFWGHGGKYIPKTIAGPNPKFEAVDDANFAVLTERGMYVARFVSFSKGDLMRFIREQEL